MQGGAAETWKDNVLDEIAKGTSDVETMEELFEKMKEEFREFDEESRKADELRLLVQGSRMCDEYVQEFRRAARGSGYEGRALIDEFKRGLNRTIKRKLAKAESPPSMIAEWQERVVKLDRNTRQSKAKDRAMTGLVQSQGTNAPQCHKPLLSPSTLSLFFSFSLPFFSIYSVGNSVTLCDLMRDKVTSRSHHGHGHMSRSQDMSHIVWLGVRDN